VVFLDVGFHLEYLCVRKGKMGMVVVEGQVRSESCCWLAVWKFGFKGPDPSSPCCVRVARDNGVQCEKRCLALESCTQYKSSTSGKLKTENSSRLHVQTSKKKSFAFCALVSFVSPSSQLVNNQGIYLRRPSVRPSSSSIKIRYKHCPNAFSAFPMLFTFTLSHPSLSLVSSAVLRN
jgi:hypothetical protein